MKNKCYEDKKEGQINSDKIDFGEKVTSKQNLERFRGALPSTEGQGGQCKQGEQHEHMFMRSPQEMASNKRAGYMNMVEQSWGKKLERWVKKIPMPWKQPFYSPCQ